MGPLVVGPLVVGMAGTALADVDLSPSVSTGLTLTDNRDFEHDAESDLILSLTPRIGLRQVGGRSNTALDYSVSAQYAHRDTEADLIHTLNGTNTMELIDSFLFVDSAAGVDQQVIDNASGVPARSNQSGSNLSTVQRYSISPYVLHQFGSFADSESRLRAGYVTSNSDELDTETELAARQVLSSGRDFTSFTWTLSANLEKTSGDEEDRETQTYRLDTATFVTRQVTVLGGIGYEKIQDESLREEPNGLIWNAGLRLKPGPRLTMEATYGERFEEQNIGAKVDYQITSRTTFNASYSQDLTTQQQLLLNDLSFIGVDENGNLIDTRTGLPLNSSFSRFGLSDETFRRDILSARLATNRGRDRYSATASYEVRESGDDDESEKIKSIGVTWSHDLTRSMTLNTSVDYDNIDFSGVDEGREDNMYSFQASLTEQIASDVDATATYVFRRLDSNQNSEDATENAILFTLTKSF
jgi:uncharacterized protein (PEP-CTERM system associated)